MKTALRIRHLLAIAALVCGLASGVRAQRSSAADANPSAPSQPSAAPQRSASPQRNEPSAAKPEHATPPNAATAPSPTLEAARQRWERLSPEERARARERYEKYLALSEAERIELAERAQRLKENSARLQRELSPEVRERLSTLEPAKRHELIGELLEGEAREKGQRIRELLPESVVKRLESARPEDRARFLAEFKAQQRKRVARYAIDQLGHRLQLSAQEVERLKSLPDDERAQAVLELRKQLTEREAEEFGLPPELSRHEWEAWEALPPEEFFEKMQRYRHMRIVHQSDGERAHDGNASDARAVDEGRHDAAQDSARAPDSAAHSIESSGASRNPKRDAHSERAQPSPERSQALHELSEARRVRPSDFIDLAPLSKAERAVRIEHRRRERCLAAIRDGHLLPPDRIEELASAPDPLFFESVRRLLATPNAPPPKSGSEIR